MFKKTNFQIESFPCIRIKYTGKTFDYFITLMVYFIHSVKTDTPFNLAYFESEVNTDR